MKRLFAIANAIFWMASAASAEAPPSLKAFSPSVVQITSTMRIEKVRATIGKDTEPSTYIAASSGFVIDGAKGLVLTLRSNVSSSNHIQVTLNDGRQLAAEVVAEDEIFDIAILRLTDLSLSPLAFCADSPRSGDATITLGYPMGRGPEAYSGRITGTDVIIRGLPFPVLTLNMPVQRGTAGAPVLTEQGCVLGLAVDFVDTDRKSYKSGVVWPSKQMQPAVTELIRSGHVAHSWIGASVDDRDGVLVTAVVPGSPADAAGIVPGDRIDAYGGYPKASAAGLTRYIASQPFGSEITVTVRRSNGVMSVKITTISEPLKNPGS